MVTVPPDTASSPEQAAADENTNRHSVQSAIV
jgi:hypothetical protein